jgi:signal recognition particle subunit SRP54
VTAQAGAEWFPSTPDQKPHDIAVAALDYAKRHFFDVLLVDTAGRLAIDELLMAEIKDLHALVNVLWKPISAEPKRTDFALAA